ncbi:DUF3885 domain-containing protein [Pseudomonas gingeri]|uniref:DUF3885 domain-containing protein n=1 Tax=Pseudomonas gingeri TaxID=117681 RepID=UPI0015A48BB4|nr:DUF3885 domain-containing protein [Pseudomonas gingeri]NVZ75850.1 DUF3885 domain-containing protein [Pseudomonas gingeri]NWD05580.1 DUF3885 domain-containing protein [Pseudomonas gingeri]NWE35832.1 DUF3885 domain-containing protein [Pseudomonas gingeri]NWE57959.1 DUF3885 domain-containing protein [Pseudomonas gingeri]
MNLQNEIERIFGENIFARPLFYSYRGGLRFALSESGGNIDMFLTALRKASRICQDIFGAEESLVVSLRAHSDGNYFACRPELRVLRKAGIVIPRTRTLWREDIEVEERCFEDRPEYWVNVAFQVPVSKLEALLWLALAKDLGVIEPTIHCALYLFNLSQRILVFPYDDRGMDVVGPNPARLSQLYHQHQQYLLDYDRETMDSTFAV